jgi:hypothetical protein
MNERRRLLFTAFAAALAPAAFAQGQGKGQDKGGPDKGPAGPDKGAGGPAQGGQKKKQHHHNNGQAKLGDKIKTNGNHVLEKKGPHTVSVDVKDGKVAGMKVKHDQKGDVAVKKYKTNKKMAANTGIHMAAYDTMLAQAYSRGTTWIGYAYIDDWGDEQIYWYPVEMIYDGDTGAVEYVPIA